jgi:RNA polymerase primary sigma factor
VRVYFCEIRSVDLLSREGEIAVAKRIEAGREAMIAGLCESPLTFQAIIIWRDELNDRRGRQSGNWCPATGEGPRRQAADFKL